MHIFWVYSVSAVLLGIAVLFTGTTFSGYGKENYLIFVILALIPTILGHSSLNWSLKHISPTVVSVAILGEPVIATILAVFILSEQPSVMQLIGGATILIGIYVSMKTKT